MRKVWIWGITVVMTAGMIIACGRKEEQPESLQQENVRTESESAAEEYLIQHTESAETNAGKEKIIGGSTQELIYEVENETKTYQAEDGTVIFEAKLAYPTMIGDSENLLAINEFFLKWRDEKIREYENDDDSTWHSALEVYRESRDFGWMGPWSEEYMVTSVAAQNDYISVLLDSYLYEGGNHGIPYRESFWFRQSDGRRVSLMRESGLGENEWERMLEARFLELVNEAEPGTYYSDADRILADVDWDEIGSYYGDSGIVFYLPPYEIGPYASGYAEVKISYDEIFGTY